MSFTRHRIIFILVFMLLNVALGDQPPQTTKQQLMTNERETAQSGELTSFFYFLGFLQFLSDVAKRKIVIAIKNCRHDSIELVFTTRPFCAFSIIFFVFIFIFSHVSLTTRRRRLLTSSSCSVTRRWTIIMTLLLILLSLSFFSRFDSNLFANRR